MVPLNQGTVLFSDEVKLYVNKNKEANLFLMTLENLYITNLELMETKVIKLSDIDCLIVSTTVPSGLGI